MTIKRALDSIDSYQYPSLKTKLNDMNNKNKDAEALLKYTQHYVRGIIFLRVLASIFTIGLIPLFHLISAIKYNNKNGLFFEEDNIELNYVKAPYYDTISIVNEFKQLAKPNKAPSVKRLVECPLFQEKIIRMHHLVAIL